MPNRMRSTRDCLCSILIFLPNAVLRITFLIGLPSRAYGQSISTYAAASPLHFSGANHQKYKRTLHFAITPNKKSQDTRS